MWREQEAVTWWGLLPAAGQPVTPLAGSTAAIVDALARFTGPAVNPTATDVITSAAIGLRGGSDRILAPESRS
jgi:hypothetical protein